MRQPIHRPIKRRKPCAHSARPSGTTYRQIFWLRVGGRVALLVAIILSCNVAYQWDRKPILDPATQVKISGPLESLSEGGSTNKGKKRLEFRIVGDENAYFVSRNIWPGRLPEGKRVLTVLKPGDSVTVTFDGRTEFRSQRRMVIGLSSNGRDWLTPEDYAKWIRSNRVALVLILTVLVLVTSFFGWYPYPVAKQFKADRRAARVWAFFWLFGRGSAPVLVVVLVYFGLENFRALRANDQPLENGTVVERSDDRFAFIIPSYKISIDDGEKRLIVRGPKSELSRAPDEVEFQRISDTEAYIPSLQSPPVWTFVFLLVCVPIHLWVTGLGKRMNARMVKDLDLAILESEQLEAKMSQGADKPKSDSRSL